MNDNPLIKKYGEEKRWVSYRIIERDGRKTKVPYQTNGKPASSTDEVTWSTYAELNGAQAGIVFTGSKRLLGVDIDKCLTDNKITHEKNEEIAELILEADTYTEKSVSGTGLHLYLAIEDEGGIDLESNRKGSFEVYTHGRYFVFTGQSYGEERDVRTVSKEEAIRLLQIIGYPWKDTKDDEVPTLAPSSVSLSDESLLKKVFRAKNGKKFKTLYDGDTSLYNNDESSADMALCSTLAFWTQKNNQQIERIWMDSPLGQREKTQKRSDYRKRTIDNAIKNCVEVYETQASKLEKGEAAELDLLFILNDRKEKVFIQNTENICRILRKHNEFVGRFRYDEFKNCYEMKVSNRWRMLEDNDAVDIQTRLSVLFPFLLKVGKELARDAVMKVCMEYRFDSAADYIKSIKWDGIARLDNWLYDTCKVSKDIYHVAVASNFIKGMIKRIVEPGCKFDYVLVLEGPQGVGKSTLLSALAGDWYAETNMGTDNKDFFMQMQGKALVEFAEGETLNRTEVKRMKAIITTRSDRYRPPFGRASQDFPRHCVFAMTTNQSEYLKDETGNRRWLPVTVVSDKVDIAWMEKNRDQIFAEAYHRIIVLKETIYEFPKEETIDAQKQRMILDPNTDGVIEWYHHKMNQDDRDRGVTTFMAYRDVYCGGYVNKPLEKYHEMIIANIFKSMIGLTKRRSMTNGIQLTRWFDDTHGIVTPKEIDPRNTKDTITADEIGNDAGWN